MVAGACGTPQLTPAAPQLPRYKIYYSSSCLSYPTKEVRHDLASLRPKGSAMPKATNTNKQMINGTSHAQVKLTENNPWWKNKWIWIGLAASVTAYTMLLKNKMIATVVEAALNQETRRRRQRQLTNNRRL